MSCVQQPLVRVSDAGGKREDFQRVEAELLRSARHLIRDRGFQALTMSRLAHESGFSRKTVYNHFDNVEDLVLGLCIQSTARRADLSSRAAQFRGRPRERAAALGSVAREVLPFHMKHEVLLSVIRLDRTSEGRRLRLRAEQERVLSISAGVIRDGVAVGDLELPEGTTPEHLAVALSLIEGGPFAVQQPGFGVGGYSLEDTLSTFMHIITVFLDDLGWRPLSTEFDYLASIRRMWREVFPELLERFGSSS
jgi:AcrR family transcriptional regulator